MRTTFRLLVVVLALVSCGGEVGVDPAVEVGQAAPGFSLPSLDGDTVTLHSLIGDFVVLNFWASWCVPCREEIPQLKAIAASGKAKVIGVALDQGGIETVRPFVDSQGINYTVLLGDEDVFRRFDGYGIPFTLLLDDAHRIVRIYRGPVTGELLEEITDRWSTTSS